jgi:hypothetical protein
MNEHPAHRFLIRTEVVFTTLQDMDLSDAGHFFKQELAEWEGRMDLDFESVKSIEVEGLPSDDDAYADLMLDERCAKEREVHEAFEGLSPSQQREFLMKRLGLEGTPDW